MIILTERLIRNHSYHLQFTQKPSMKTNYQNQNKD